MIAEANGARSTPLQSGRFSCLAADTMDSGEEEGNNDS